MIQPRAWRRLDGLVLANVALFAALVASAFARRDLAVGERAVLPEFAVYACFAAAALGALWSLLRRVELSPAALVALQAAIALHFAGGLLSIDGTRLYDVLILGIGFDKLVHAVNAAIFACLVTALLRAHGARLHRLEQPIVVLLVLGLGAVWEIVEYGTISAFPDAGVGEYGNNARDLIANLTGATLSRLLPSSWRARIERPLPAPIGAKLVAGPTAPLADA